MSDLGTARGRIVIDTSDLRRAQDEVKSASEIMTQALNKVGIALGVREVARFVVEADKLATSYRRQEVAARGLAGSQAELNTLLNVYDKATGDAIGKAEALANVTKLLSVGFADDAEELDKFARAIRGISIAMGTSQDTVTQNLILELFTQRGARLDQLGLQYDLVRKRADELSAADRSLTKEMAYQQAVLEQAQERFGGMADSAEGAATGLERLQKAWADFQLQFGQGSSGGTNLIFDQWAKDIEVMSEQLEQFLNLLDRAQRLGALFRFNIGLSNAPAGMAGPPIGPQMQPPGISSGGATPVTPSFTADQLTAITEWRRGTLEIEEQAARDRLAATRQFEQQRSDTIRQYEQSIAREAQDFAIQRVRDEEDYALSLQRMRRDIAQREASQLADLERTIADARQDAAERGAERQAALDERIIETRSQANERIAELEADFTKRRERSQRDFADRLRDAAANLDAVAVREAQRDFRRSQQEAQEDFDERLAKERKNEEKRLAELNKTHAKQTADEGRALQKRIDQANEAYQRQLEDARAADEQRLADMSEDRAIRLERENEDRALRLERMAEDHQAQLDEMARQHELEMERITEEEAEELAAHNTAFDEQMASLNEYHAGVRERQDAFQAEALESYQEYLDAQAAELARRTRVETAPGTSPGMSPISGQFPSLTPTTVVPNSVSNNRSSHLTVGALIINTQPGMNEQAVGDLVLQRMAEFYEEMAN